MADKKGIQSLERAFSIIEALAASATSGVSKLARDTSLSKATVYRILNTLVDLGYVMRDGSTDKYSLTLKFLTISAEQLANYDIHKRMRPILEQIAKISGETVHLVERQGETVVYIDKCESNTNSVRMVSRIGMTSDIFTTAVGKAMLARLEDSEIVRLWNSYPHVKKTEHTIIDLSEYLKEIENVRKLGYAIDNEENELDVRCVAVAVPDSHGEYKYAVSISAPKNRSDAEILKKRAQLLKDYLK
ncbi:MAG: IclR family transcriptional regulator [Acutalibacteraceae bacterium]|jgi:DNA-binding IclR family transcriptional regulator